MSLLRLLSSGKSLVGAKDGGPRYRLGTRESLPAFRLVRNPFRKPITPGVTRGGTAPVEYRRQTADSQRDLPPEGPQGPECPQAGHESFSCGGAQAVPSPTDPPTDSSGRAKKSAGCGRGADVGGGDGTGGILSRLARWLTWRRRRTGREMIEPRRSPIPVQGELSLDNVKVVRNDLSDADLEVVRVSTRPAQRGSTVERPVSSELRQKAETFPPKRQGAETGKSGSKRGILEKISILRS